MEDDKEKLAELGNLIGKDSKLLIKKREEISFLYPSKAHTSQSELFFQDIRLADKKKMRL